MSLIIHASWGPATPYEALYCKLCFSDAVSSFSVQHSSNLIKMAIKAELNRIKWFPLMSYLIQWFGVEDVHYCPLLGFELLDNKFYK